MVNKNELEREDDIVGGDWAEWKNRKLREEKLVGETGDKDKERVKERIETLGREIRRYFNII